MAKPLNKITKAAHKTQFVPRMYDAVTEILTPLKFLLPIVDIVRELLDISPDLSADTNTIDPLISVDSTNDDWPSAALTREPAEPKATVLFANEARELASQLKNGCQMVARGKPKFC